MPSRDRGQSNREVIAVKRQVSRKAQKIYIGKFLPSFFKQCIFFATTIGVFSVSHTAHGQDVGKIEIGRGGSREGQEPKDRMRRYAQIISEHFILKEVNVKQVTHIFEYLNT